MSARLAHVAINADDLPRARTFYEKAFGWKTTAWGPPGFYMFDTGQKDGLLGSLQGRRELLPGARMVGLEGTLAVESIDDAEKRIVAAGGQIVMARSRIDGVGTLLFFRDTEGNVLGAMEYEKR
jgi:hypothetical protein